MIGNVVITMVDLWRSFWTLMFVPVLFSPTILSMSGTGKDR